MVEFSGDNNSFAISLELDKCPECGGSGAMIVKVLKDCPICDGIGTVLGKLCPKCKGDNSAIEIEETCRCKACLGLGFVV